MSDHYQQLVVNPLKQLEMDGKGVLRAIGPGKVNPVYLFQVNGSNVFVTSMHHANECYGTWQPVIEAIKKGTKINAVPVVNADGFERSYRSVETVRGICAGDPALIHDLLHESLTGYRDAGIPKDIYPPWSRWDYGGPVGKKPQSTVEIEKLVASSAVTLDVHNHRYTSGGYFIIVHPTHSEVQHDVEEIIRSAIIRNGNSLWALNDKIFTNIGDGVYQCEPDAMTLATFAGALNKANIVLEVPSFTTDDRSHYVPVDQSRIMATNLEILTRIAEFVN